MRHRNTSASVATLSKLMLRMAGSPTSDSNPDLESEEKADEWSLFRKFPR
jgi:hypothetical protein